MTTQVALVGGAHIHTPGFIKKLLDRPDFEVKYVWDHDPARAERRAEALSSRVEPDLDKIWSDNEVAAVVICSETNRHKSLVFEAAGAEKHMFVEKPLGMGAADAYQMAEQIEKAGVIFQTGYFMRGSPVNLFLKSQVEAGAFGTITRYRHTNCHSGSLGGWFDTEWRWMADLEQAGCGAFGDLGTHALDIMLWLMGEVERVTADVAVVSGRYGETDETGEGLLRFKNGVIGSLAAGWVDVAHPLSLIISGTEGHAYVSNGELYFQSAHVEGADGKSPWTNLPQPLPHAFDLFLEAVSGKQDVPLVGAREAAYRSAVMEALYQASHEQTWVAV
jgi:predicted dehydrogenase